MQVHLVDGTYELFRQFLAPRPGHRDRDGVEVGAARAVVSSMLGDARGRRHAPRRRDRPRDRVVPQRPVGRLQDRRGHRSRAASRQFQLLEDALEALGVAVWPMVDLEADDALASAATSRPTTIAVEQAIICTPDKDLGQCVGGKVVQLDRRKEILLDADGVHAKFGVMPESIPDWLALVGDAADGFPGLPGFGAKTAAALLERYQHVEAIPDDGHEWDVPGLRSIDRLAATLAAGREVLACFKDLATLRTNADVGTVDDWDWTGPTKTLRRVVRTIRLAAPARPRAQALAKTRGSNR